MTDDEIRRSIALGLDWSVQEFAAYMNAANWLAQAQRGEVPSGNAYKPTGDASCPTSLTHSPSAKDVANTLTQEIPLSPATTEHSGIPPATEMPSTPAPEPGS